MAKHRSSSSAPHTLACFQFSGRTSPTPTRLISVQWPNKHFHANWHEFNCPAMEFKPKWGNTIKGRGVRWKDGKKIDASHFDFAICYRVAKQRRSQLQMFEAYVKNSRCTPRDCNECGDLVFVLVDHQRSNLRPKKWAARFGARHAWLCL